MTRLVLDMAAMQEDFFAETAMIGIASSVPAYRLCWLLNQHFDINFVRDPEQNIRFKRKDIEYYFAVFQYELPNSSHKYLLYQLKNGKETLLPETKQLDFIWLLQTACPDEDATEIARALRDIPDIQLAQILSADQLKSINNLLL
jgi:hypothetical protein